MSKLVKLIESGDTEAAHALILNQLDESTKVNRNTFKAAYSDVEFEFSLISDGSVSINIEAYADGHRLIKLKKIDFKELLVFLRENPIAKSVLTD